MYSSKFAFNEIFSENIQIRHHWRYSHLIKNRKSKLQGKQREKTLCVPLNFPLPMGTVYHESQLGLLLPPLTSYVNDTRDLTYLTGG